MEKNQSDYWIEGEFSKQDMADVIGNIRTEYLKKPIQEICEELGIKEDKLKECEEGKGNMQPAILKNICDKYNLQATIIIKQK
jgi:hypothetical protein